MCATGRNKQMADPATIGIILAIAGGALAARSSNKKKAAKRLAKARRNNPSNYKGDGRGTQNNSEWLRLGSGPAKR
jgi:hypothetical protein